MKNKFLIVALAFTLMLGLTIPGFASNYVADVIIVGGGGAGLSAAVSAAEQGASVILLEKMPMLGGNTLVSSGTLQAAGTEHQKRLGIVITMCVGA